MQADQEVGKPTRYITVRNSCDRPLMATPPLCPLSDIVCASSIIDIQPPIQSPGNSMFSPLVGGLIRESSGWIV